MQKLTLQTKDLVNENIKKIAEIFPGAITEVVKNGKTEYAIDFDTLKQELSCDIVEGSEERYTLTWPNKKNATLIANQRINKTLRPCREESVDFDSTQNLYIEGDNLDVLKLLQETYLNKVKMIYIDPPYNTGNDILYLNDYSLSENEYFHSYETDEEGNVLFHNTESNGRFHTDWINIMYQRIKVAKDLLSDEGCLVIAIDHYELANLLLICNEIFGEYNQIGIVTVVHKPEGRNQEKHFSTSNEFALFYAKNKNNFRFNSVIFNEGLQNSFTEEDEKSKYKLVSFIAKNHGRSGFDKNLRKNSPKNFYPIYVSSDLQDISTIEKPKYEAIFPITSTQERTWKYVLETTIQKIKEGEVIAKKIDNKIQLFEKYRIDKGELVKTHWVDKKYNATNAGTKILNELLEAKTFDFPKSLFLILDTVKLITTENDIILDFFSGSATTAHAVMQLNAEDNGNRKFILCQIPASCDEKSEAYKAGYKNICEIGKERIRRAGAKINAEIEAENAKNPLLEAKPLVDIGFRVLKTDSSNMQDVYYKPAEYTQEQLKLFVENVKLDRTAEDLLFQVMLELGILLSSQIEVQTLHNKQIFTIYQDTELYLIACFDNNINEEIVTSIAKQKPYYAVFKDSGIQNDSLMANFEQIFVAYSPDTKRMVI